MRSVLLAAACLLGACSSFQPTASPDAPTVSEPMEGIFSSRITYVGPEEVEEGIWIATRHRPKNLILFIADGFGPASATMGRAAKGAPLSFDSLLVGASETSATDSRVTDSAAGATAYSCGIKTYNGAIAMDDDRAPCVTILERAESAGLATGLVATSRITHATPASFASHVVSRSQEDEIAVQMMASGVDVLIGGGRKRFRGELALQDLLAQADSMGWTVANDRAGFDALDATPALALLSEDHLAYEVDRVSAVEPSLAEMTRRALDLLSQTADGAANGFFVMIEGSRIDHAAHGNDPAGHLGDILAFDAAVAEALAWAAADGETLVVSTADHETGGMTLGADGVYAWDPAPLLAATASFEVMARRIAAGDDIARVLSEGLALDAPNAEDVAAIQAALDAQDRIAGERAMGVAASRAANIGWTTGGHTAVDVGVYAFGPGADVFRGAMGNDEVGRRLAAILLGD